MAIRTKTIEFATTVDITTLVGATNRDKSITIYIPEGSGTITFRNVTLLCYFRGDNTVAASLGLVNLSIATNVGFTGATTLNLGTPNANSGESETWGYAGDCTSFFTSNWSGTSNTWYVRYNGVTLATNNHSFKLIITYDYDDTQTTHIKTIRIPIESTRTILTTSWQTIGGTTPLPDIGGSYLPEDSVVVRQAFLELSGNEASIAATDFTTQIRVNGGSAIDIWRSEQALSGNGCYMYSTIDITAEDLSVARSLEAIVVGVTNRVDYLGGWLTVTYEFDSSATTTIYNSLLLGAIDTTGWAGGTTTGDADAWGRNIYIQEPGTITLKESGVFIGSNDLGGYTLNLAVGLQGNTAFTHTASSLQLGQFTTMHRIDAGGAAGVNFTTLVRGKNSYKIVARSGTSVAGWGLNGFLILNYTSGVPSDGVGAHSSSKFYLLSPSNNDGQIEQVNSKSCTIAESNYWLNGVVTESWVNMDNTTNSSIAIHAERLVGEGEESGWETLGVIQYRTDNENHFLNGRYASRKAWRRWPGDTDSDRLDLESSRSFRLDTPVLSTSAYGLWVTYHSIESTVSGNISGSGGGTVNIYLCRASTGERLLSTSRVGDGTYSFDWLEDTEDVYVVAYESSSYKGVSKEDVAGSGFDISLSTGSSTTVGGRILII